MASDTESAAVETHLMEEERLHADLHRDCLPVECDASWFVRRLTEAREKLASVRDWQEDWYGVGPTIDWSALSAILEVKGE